MRRVLLIATVLVGILSVEWSALVAQNSPAPERDIVDMPFSHGMVELAAAAGSAPGEPSPHKGTLTGEALEILRRKEAAAASQPAAATSKPAAGVIKAARPVHEMKFNSCVTSQCHANVKQYKNLHGPINVDACNACHAFTDVKKHTFKLTRDKKAVCTFCHKMEVGDAKYVHKPVKQGDCLPCHNPHGATNKRFLRGETMTDLCMKCHKTFNVAKKSVHGPVAAGACGACHRGHYATLPKRLVAEGRNLCLGCHAEMKKQITEAKFSHKAVEKDCIQCHDAHASDYAMQIKMSPKKLCTDSCHEKVKTAVTSATHKHSIVIEGQACMNCHTAHGGDLAKLMRTTPIKACMKCHDKEIVDKTGRKVAGVSEVLNPDLHRHGPLRKESCGNCHAVHGGDHTRLLTQSHPETFYESFSADKYGLCFTCHNKQLALAETTKAVTSFRDGTRNLHFVHVNKVRKGRSCPACHSTHASTNAMHIRESVPYGSWQLPVSFTKSPTGGTCASGCHKTLAYDRTKAVNVPAAKPAGPVVAVPAKSPANPPAKAPATAPVKSDTKVKQPTPAAPEGKAVAKEHSS